MPIRHGDAVAFDAFGTITTDTQTDVVTGRGWVTGTAHLDSGTGTWTWQFKGVDSVWRTIIAGTDFITEMVFVDASNMLNVYFATDVLIRADATSGSSPVWDWQIMGDQINRGGSNR